MCVCVCVCGSGFIACCFVFPHSRHQSKALGFRVLPAASLVLRETVGSSQRCGPEGPAPESYTHFVYEQNQHSFVYDSIDAMFRIIQTTLVFFFLQKHIWMQAEEEEFPKYPENQKLH